MLDISKILSNVFSPVIFISGRYGLVGSAIERQLRKRGFNNIVGQSHDELDLTNYETTLHFMKVYKPDIVFLASAKVGGIIANKENPVGFLLDNLKIQNNIIEISSKIGVSKLLFLGSSCIYPRDSQQPIKEESLMTGLLETTNEAYAIAKIAGIKLCQSYNQQHGKKFISVMPTNLTGINDNFHPNNSHVIPGMIRKIHLAKENKFPYVELWGDGSPLREFMFSDDLADACIYLVNNYEESKIVNIGSGLEIQLRDLAEIIKNVIGYEGEIRWDKTKPNGTPRKLLDSSYLRSLGYESKHTPLKKMIETTYYWALFNNKLDV